MFTLPDAFRVWVTLDYNFIPKHFLQDKIALLDAPLSHLKFSDIFHYKILQASPRSSKHLQIFWCSRLPVANAGRSIPDNDEELAPKTGGLRETRKWKGIQRYPSNDNCSIHAIQLQWSACCQDQMMVLLKNQKLRTWQSRLKACGGWWHVRASPCIF